MSDVPDSPAEAETPDVTSEGTDTSASATDAELPVPAADAELPATAPDPDAEPEEGKDDEVEEYRMTLLEHLIELRSRMIKSGIGLIAALCIALPFGGRLFDFLIAPAQDNLHGGEFIAKKLYEAFMTDLKVGFFGALIIAMPIIAYQVWGFVAPGLYKKERRLIIPFVVLATLLFLVGMSLCYYGILPYAIDFFTSYNEKRGFSSLLTVSDYLAFIMRFLIAFGVVFQTPLVIFFLARVGLVTAQGLGKFRRYAIVIGFALAAVITPPDPGSQLAVALPFIVLYEVGILTARIWGKPRPGELEPTPDDI